MGWYALCGLAIFTDILRKAKVLRESILDILLYYNHIELKLYIPNIASLLYYLRYI